MMQAMIFAAGLGTRLKPLTDTTPKALVTVGGTTLLQLVVRKLQAAGVDRMVVNVHHFASQIVDYLALHHNFGADITISDESGRLLETGGGLKMAAPLFRPDQPILIHNVDILSNVDFRAFESDMMHLRTSHSAEAVLLVSHRPSKRQLLFDSSMKLVGWTNLETGEVRTPHRHLRIDECQSFAFSGIHGFFPSFFNAMNDFPDRFGIMDFYLSRCIDYPIYGMCMPNLQLIDVGKINVIGEAEQFKNRHY